MKSLPDALTVTIPLGGEAHRLAQQFRLHQHSVAKAKQVYLNTLAVYAVEFYLKCMEIETNWKASDSYSPVMQTLMDVADLEVPNHGKLECRPVLPFSQVVEIPTEVWEDRIGYLAVQLDQSLREATILGFVETVATEELPISQLHSLKDLLANLSQPIQQQPVQSEKKLLQLSQWLQNVVDTGWETVEALFNPPQTELAFNFRNQFRVKASTPENPSEGIKRGKRLNLEQDGEQVALFVGLTPTTSLELDILVEVYPTGNQIYLPPELQLMVLSAEGEAVMQAQARNSNKHIQIEFSGEPGEQFSVKVALGNASFTQAFLI
jgi:hypothetical protein